MHRLKDLSPNSSAKQAKTKPRNITQKGRLTNKLLYLRELVKTLYEHPLSLPLRQPLDAEKLNAPNFYKAVKYPQDLGTIMRRLQSNEYYSSNQCIRDVKALFVNIYMYFRPSHEIVAVANAVENVFEKGLADMDRESEEVEVPEPPAARGRVHASECTPGKRRRAL